MQLVEINPLDVQRVFPSFYHQDSQFFMIIHDACEIGIYGVRTVDPKKCEISLFVFKECRNKLYYRKWLHLLLSYPFSLGFEVIYISSNKKSVVTLMAQLAQCRTLGVDYIGEKNKKMWFKRERQRT